VFVVLGLDFGEIFVNLGIVVFFKVERQIVLSWSCQKQGKNKKKQKNQNLAKAIQIT
jgi:hypothetical protein